MPTSALGVLVFVLAVAPGFYYELERSRRFTRAQESAFYEVSRALVASIVIGIPSAAVAFIAWWTATPWDPPDITALLKRDPQYLGAHTGPIVLSLIAYIAAGAVIVRGVHRLKPRLAARWQASRLAIKLMPRRSKGSGGIQTAHSLWYELFRRRTPEGYEPIATVFMKSGAVWIGKVGSYSTEHEVTHRELVITKPVLYSESPTNSFTKTPHTAMILKGSEIESIAVMYGLKDA